MPDNDDPDDPDDPTRTTDEPAGAALPQPPPHRLVAPLQPRDPGRYEILGEHGRGGLGVVSRVHDKELGRDVAIKELIRRGDIGEIRFLREAMITARLEHPGIVPVHEAGRWPDGTPFYVMKLVAGRSLKELLAERTTVEKRLELLPHVIAVAEAVAYAHKRKIIHRDLKASNVMVGDFGETVVIDWGLAKDLSTSEETGVPEAPFRAAPLDDLTAAGHQMGTPDYMPPEQQRGEAVDQRADVYAIGMMLWQLCSPKRLPPADARARDRALARAGIDKDLVIIIRKALAPAPDDRFQDAGKLAEDLKAFKAGARIAARSYSILAVLAHWIRRHRAIAATVAAAITVAIAGSVVFVANIATERNRADTARAVAEEQRQRAEQQQQRAEQANDELVLQNAALLMQRDPTAAQRMLEGYRGEDTGRLKLLQAEVEGRGVAVDEFAPHSGPIWFLAGTSSGAVCSLSEDRRIRVTMGTGSQTLASDLLPSGTYAYAPERELLAYGRAPAGIGLVDLRNAPTRPTSPINAGVPIDMDMTADGARLAALDSTGALTVWAISPDLSLKEVFRGSTPNGIQIFFAGPTHVIIREKVALRVVSLDAGQIGEPRAMQFTSVHVRGPDVVIGDEAGFITLLTRELTQVTRLQACGQRVNNVHFAQSANVMAVACRDNKVSLIRYNDLHGGAPTQDVFPTSEETLEARPDATGTTIAARTVSNAAYLHDAETHLTTKQEGHVSRLSFVVPPSSRYRYVLTGDFGGTVRTWAPAQQTATAILRASTPVYSPTFSRDNKFVTVGGADGVIRRIRLSDNATTVLKGHTGTVARTEPSPDGRSFMSQGVDGVIQIWAPGGQTPIRTFSDHGHATDAEYLDDGRNIISAGDNASVYIWPAFDTSFGTAHSSFFNHPNQAPISAIENLRDQGRVVVGDRQGALWDISRDRRHRQVRQPDNDLLTVLRASRDGAFLAAGFNSGRFTFYETTNYSIVHEGTLDGGVHHIQFDPHSRDSIAISKRGTIRVIPLSPHRRLTWPTLTFSAHNAAYSEDGETIAFVSRDGATWFYTAPTDRWSFSRTHVSDVRWGAFSHDNTRFASADHNGMVVIHDMIRIFPKRPDNEQAEAKPPRAGAQEE